MRTVAAALYWIVAITITLAAYGHGFLGIKPVEAAIAATTLPPDILRVIWIVWYDVSGSMLTFGVLLFWAWPSVKTGSSSRSGVPLIIGAFYAATGIGAPEARSPEPVANCSLKSVVCRRHRVKPDVSASTIARAQRVAVLCRSAEG